MSNKAKFVKEIMVTDPDTKGEVHLAVYKHENGGMFAIDSSYIEQIDPHGCPDAEDEITIEVYDPFADFGYPTTLYLED